MAAVKLVKDTYSHISACTYILNTHLHAHLYTHIFKRSQYDTIRYFNVRSKADISQLNLPHGTDN